MKLSVVMPDIEEQTVGNDPARQGGRPGADSTWRSSLSTMAQMTTQGDSEGHSGIRVVLHERNSGKGAAVKSGFRAATGDIVLIQDADLDADPRDYGALLQPILDRQVDAVMDSAIHLRAPAVLWQGRQVPF